MLLFKEFIAVYYSYYPKGRGEWGLTSRKNLKTVVKSAFFNVKTGNFCQDIKKKKKNSRKNKLNVLCFSLFKISSVVITH